jgi:hypothetical protein
MLVRSSASSSSIVVGDCTMMLLVPLRLAYLGVTNVFALLRLLPAGDRDKDIEILSLRHQLAVLQRRLGGLWFEPADRGGRQCCCTRRHGRPCG